MRIHTCAKTFRKKNENIYSNSNVRLGEHIQQRENQSEFIPSGISESRDNSKEQGEKNTKVDIDKGGENHGLFQHQIVGVEFLKEKRKVILADEMGLGKTRQAIIAIGKSKGMKLVICPASLKINWKREILMVYENEKVQTIESGKEVRIEEDGWVIINYDMLLKYRDQILRLKIAGKIIAGVLDEAHYIKGKKTQRALIAIEIIKGLEMVYALTGTPIMNRPAEMFNLLRVIDHPLGRNKSFFSKRYCGGHLKTIARRNGSIIRFWDESGASRLPELRELTRESILRRTKDEVLNLPPKIISVEIVEMSKEWQKEYDQAWDNYLAWVESHPEGKDIENILSAQSLVELVKLKQVCSKAKVDRIVSDIENSIEQENKVIVFTQFTETVKTLRERLAEKGIISVQLTGQDDMDERQVAVDRFQKESDVKVFIANIKAGGVGITLTSASQVIFADMEWSPAIQSQAEDRAHRIGQNGTVNVHYYVCEQTIEEDIVEILQRKLQTIQAIVEGKDSPEDGSLGAEFLKRIKDKINKK